MRITTKHHIHLTLCIKYYYGPPIENKHQSTPIPMSIWTWMEVVNGHHMSRLKYTLTFLSFFLCCEVNYLLHISGLDKMKSPMTKSMLLVIFVKENAIKLSEFVDHKFGMNIQPIMLKLIILVLICLGLCVRWFFLGRGETHSPYHFLHIFRDFIRIYMPFW